MGDVLSEPASRSDARQNRARLLAAARSVFAEKGTAAEIKDIAERAGVGIGTFYRNFATKDELVQALVDGIVAAMGEALTAAEQMADARDGLRSLFATGWALVEEHGALISALIDEGHAHHQTTEDLSGRVAALIRRGVERGQLRGNVPAAFMADFLEVTMPVVYLHLRRRWEAADAARYCDALLLAALSAPADAPGRPIGSQT